MRPPIVVKLLLSWTLYSFPSTIRKSSGLGVYVGVDCPQLVIASRQAKKHAAILKASRCMSRWLLRRRRVVQEKGNSEQALALPSRPVGEWALIPMQPFLPFRLAYANPRPKLAERGLYEY